MIFRSVLGYQMNIAISVAVEIHLKLIVAQVGKIIGSSGAALHIEIIAVAVLQNRPLEVIVRGIVDIACEVPSFCRLSGVTPIGIGDTGIDFIAHRDTHCRFAIGSAHYNRMVEILIEVIAIRSDFFEFSYQRRCSIVDIEVAIITLPTAGDIRPVNQRSKDCMVYSCFGYTFARLYIIDSGRPVICTMIATLPVACTRWMYI